MKKLFPLFLVLLLAIATRAQDSTQTARRVVVGVTNDAVTGTTAPTGSSVVLEGAYQIETSSASYSTGMTWTASPPWAAAIAAFDSPLAVNKARRSSCPRIFLYYADSNCGGRLNLKPF